MMASSNVFIREHDGDRLLVAVNAGDHTADARIVLEGLGPDLRLVWGSGELLADADGVRVTMQPRTGCVW